MCTDFDFIENKENSCLLFDIESYTKAVKTIGILASPIPITPKKRGKHSLNLFFKGRS